MIINMEENLDLYFGYIEIGLIRNYRPIIADTDDLIKLPFTDNLIKFVQYPDCQQLILWLPDNGIKYKNVILYNSDLQAEKWNKEITQVLNGSIQIILDSSLIAPGNYKLLIQKCDGLMHEISFFKAAEYNKPVEEKIIYTPEAYIQNEAIIYKDGFGNMLPNEDLILRDEVMVKTFNKFMRDVKYENQGRGGYAIFVEGLKSIKFEMEYGGGDCIFILYIPSSEKWETHTAFSLRDRDEIIKFVAERVLRDQTTSSDAYYKISETDIAYFNK